MIKFNLTEVRDWLYLGLTVVLVGLIVQQNQKINQIANEPKHEKVLIHTVVDSIYYDTTHLLNGDLLTEKRIRVHRFDTFVDSFNLYLKELKIYDYR